ncbi:MAG TPA: Asp-tRNA(Asn)/Glu-tRNA(Gln) amidotransferase subunit GatC [Anaerohalosphaeraceae bacterium]|nr:Asp-tRNA(Asn)/Glu-tRNA(Gln) amidotransferase subunit GatC [Phycisphaerae bacterium]HOK95642.1 Asp-tRNA(Asn)/Glu-tRNA(Gln) amidotransferase subunit GatC [Anaerohalosphaeraceae bacterium]HOL32087.1 Asp-tRNA(Asn)/Glu-tRNA(Gln) amidotransferase subunit GatC [Anaerohalosphaeraceae bacterium]HOM75515.1 Asp-tRNA(Asn)/Glu-tRNA(Gln) amidotransferase subunit GatC [Anaerohalosphaeraceae bacterium]HPC64910.1 Asp-tRNA(Asn)/Glu-tRNA(Gln) amidotransferase subunit GatC [Anaerohalosphaeraceae bacterium]
MAVKIDQNQVRRVALLSRLDLTDDEVRQFSVQLSAIVAYIEKLSQLNTDGVEPLAHCLPVHNVFRDDQPRPSLPNEAALANAPERYGEYFKVPRILDDSSGA